MSGEATLQAVWSLVDRHVKLKDAKASSAEVKALRTEQKAVKSATVPDAIEAFLARHGERLQVTRGHGTALPKTLPVHPLHRALVAHFGFLELRLSPGFWAAQTHRDGLRLVGLAPAIPWCDLEPLRVLHEREQARRTGPYASDDDKKEGAKLAPLVPMLTSLEGLRGAWVGGPRIVAVAGHPNDRSDTDLAGASEPRFGAAYALLARLRLLEQRIHNAAVTNALAARCERFAPVDLDPSASLCLRSDPRVLLDPPLQLLGSGYHTSVRTVLEHVSQGRGFKTDTAQEARAKALDARLSLTGWGVSIQHSGQTTQARYDLGASPSDDKVAYGLGVLAHLHRMLADPAMPEFDDVPTMIPPEVAAMLDLAGASAEALPASLGVTVQGVGRLLPRVRWRVAATATNDTALWREQSHQGRAIKVASAAFADLSPAWLARLTGSLGPSANGDGMTALERRRLAATMQAITEETQALLARASSTGASPTTWRSVALDRPMAAKDFIEAARAHARWLRDRAPGPHRFTSHAWLDLHFALYRGDDPHADVLRLDASRHDLRSIDASELDLTAATLVHVVATGVKFDRARLTAAMALDADFQGASFAGADLRGADFSRSDLQGASFRGADCTDADFEKCNLGECDFEGAVLSGAKLKGSIAPPTTG